VPPAFDARISCDGAGRGRRQRVAEAYSRFERPEQMGDAVRVVGDELSTAGQHDVAVAVRGEHPAHRQHPPGSVEYLFNSDLAPNHSSIELDQHVTHLGHALDESVAGDEIAVEALD